MSTDSAILLAGVIGTALTAAAGPYAPAAGQPGSTAIPANSTRFVAWATGATNYLPGGECAPQWQTPNSALGPASGDPTNIVCLGRSGRITFTFELPITDGPGADFAVFENAVTDTFLELGYVEVSSDGTHFVRFPTHSLSPQSTDPIPNLQEYDPTDVHGFAGKYRGGYGTPFDLADLPEPIAEPIRYVRVIDIVGDGAASDSHGNPVYDPYPMVDSAGVDLDGVGVIHFPTMCTLTSGAGGLALEWPAVTNRWYQPQYAASAGAPWNNLGDLVAGDDHLRQVVITNPPGGSAVFRIVQREVP